MKLLDRSRPFGEVHGVSQVRFEQDGLPFDRLGREIINGVIAPEPDEPEVPIMPDQDVVDYRKLTAVQLQLLVETFGEKYTNKPNAIAFLEGRDVG